MIIKLTFYFTIALSLASCISGSDSKPIYKEYIEGDEIVELEPTFKSLNDNLFKPRCLSCHSPGGEEEETPLVTYEDFILEENDIIYLDAPEDSTLLYRLLHTKANKVMPPPDSGEKKFTEKQIKTVLEWIELGAPKE